MIVITQNTLVLFSAPCVKLAAGVLTRSFQHQVFEPADTLVGDMLLLRHFFSLGGLRHVRHVASFGGLRHVHHVALSVSLPIAGGRVAADSWACLEEPCAGKFDSE